jgi:hypothetical protein
MNLVVTARRMVVSGRVRARTLWIVRGMRLRHFLPAPVVLLLVLALGLTLIQVPGLDFGWWTHLGGQGNPVFGQTEAIAGTLIAWLIPVVFVLLLIPCLPLFAEREERAFRLGAEGWSWRRRIRRSVEFGLVHAIIGIPIGIALALSAGGIYFTLAYLRGYRSGGREQALAESTRTHLGYNLTIVLLVLPVLVLSSQTG